MTVDAALVGTLDRKMDWLMMPESEKFTDLLLPCTFYPMATCTRHWKIIRF